MVLPPAPPLRTRSKLIQWCCAISAATSTLFTARSSVYFLQQPPSAAAFPGTYATAHAQYRCRVESWVSGRTTPYNRNRTSEAGKLECRREYQGFFWSVDHGTIDIDRAEQRWNSAISRGGLLSWYSRGKSAFCLSGKAIESNPYGRTDEVGKVSMLTARPPGAARSSIMYQATCDFFPFFPLRGLIVSISKQIV